MRDTLARTPVALADVQATRDAHAVGDRQRRCRERLSVSAETAWLLARTDPFGRARPALGASHSILPTGKAPEALCDAVSSLRLMELSTKPPALFYL